MGTSSSTSASITPHVVVRDSVILITNLVEHDPDVVRVVGDSDRPELAVHNLLVIGAHATVGASMHLDAHIVERRFEDMTESFDAKVQAAVTTLTDATEQLLDEEQGALPAILNDLKSDIGTILGETFDEDSKSSVIAKIETVLSAATEHLDKKVRGALDPDSPDSPLARTKQDVLVAVKEQAGYVLKELREVALMVAAQSGRAELVEKTAGKGFTFEDLIEEGIGSVAAIHGDIAERVGARSGSSGNKNGDLLVTLSCDDTCGQEARFVIEAKDRGLGMTKTLAELDKALDNHCAVAAIAVFSRQSLAPTSVPFFWSGNRAIVVYDKDDPDPRCLELGYAWARWVARRAMSLSQDAEIDVARIEAALSRARQALTRHQTIKACHSTARKKIEEAALHVVGLVDEVDEALKEVWDELNN